MALASFRRIAPLVAAWTSLTAVPWAQIPGDTDTTSELKTFQTTQLGVDLTTGPLQFTAACPEHGAAHPARICWVQNSQDPDATGTLESIALDIVNAFLEEQGLPGIPGWVFDLASGPVDISWTGAPQFDYGVYFELVDTTLADVDVTYPATMGFEYPAPDTFGCGDDITVKTTIDIEATDFNVTPPYYNVEIGFILDNFALSWKIELCFDFGFFDPLGLICGVIVDDCEWCPGSFTFTQGLDAVADGVLETLGLSAIPDVWPLMTVCHEGFVGDSTSLFGCAGDVLMGNVIGDDCAESAIACIESHAPGEVCISEGLNPVSPEFEGCFKAASNADLALASLDDGHRLALMGATDVIDLTTDVFSWLKIPDLDLGAFGSFDVIDLNMEWMADQLMSFEVAPEITVRLDLGVPMDWSVIDPDTDLAVASGSGSIVELPAGHDIRLHFPDLLEDPTTTTPSYAIESDLYSLQQWEVSAGASVDLLEIDLPGIDPYTLVDGFEVATVPIDGSPFEIYEKLQPLYGWTHPLGTSAAFVLNPEKPRLNFGDVSLVDIVKLPGGERGVVYNVTVRNDGDVPLSNMECDFDLSEIFGTAPFHVVECTTSEEFEMNADYDGTMQRNLIAPGNTLAVGQVVDMQVLVRVLPETAQAGSDGCFGAVPYTSMSAQARAVTPIGTNVRTNWDHCDFQQVGEPPVVTVDLGPEVITSLDQFAIYAWKGLHFARAFGPSEGNVGTDGQLLINSLKGDPYFEPVIIGDLHVKDDIFVLNSGLVGDYAQVGGIIKLASPKSLFELNFTSSLGSDCVASFPIPEIPVPSFDGTGSSFGGAAAPGSYGYWEVGPLQPMTLTAGVYEVDTLNVVGSDAVLTCDVSGGPIVLRLNEWNMGNAEGFKLLVEGGSTRDLRVEVLGKGPLRFRRALLQGTLMAPDEMSTIRLEEGSRVEGACYAGKIILGVGASFSHHDALEDIWLEELCSDGVE